MLGVVGLRYFKSQCGFDIYMTVGWQSTEQGDKSFMMFLNVIALKKQGLFIVLI